MLLSASRVFRGTFRRHLVGAVRYASTAPATVKVSVNGAEVDVLAGCTVMAACESAGVVVPRFCYHERLSIAGNCRMCLVEVEKSPKPVASCAYPVMPGMKIKTDTAMVKKAREGVMEFLLANHPLDCPICDQGGECDLQDQSMAFGSDRSRFREFKRAVEDKNIGPLVKTVMTRCIQCTRCIRFTTELCGVSTLGATGRGVNVEIGTYVDSILDTELSGNVIDLCPVGALTSKPYAFTTRPWELVRTDSIDVMDAVGSAIRVDTRGPEVMRILPRLNESVNEEWIGDKSRFSYDGLKRQRIDAPLIKDANGIFKAAAWQTALQTISDALQSVPAEEMIGVAGGHADCEGMAALKDLFNSVGAQTLTTELSSLQCDRADRSSYLFNSTLAGIDRADYVLLVNTNIRMEAPVIGARLRKCIASHGLVVGSIGPEMNLNMPHTHIGNGLDALSNIANGKDEFAQKFRAAKRPLIIVGVAALQGELAATTTAAVHSIVKAIPALRNDDWNGVNVLHTLASQVGAFDLGYAPVKDKSKAFRFVYLLHADNIQPELIADDAFVVYAGSHGDIGAQRANVVLPSPAYTEKSGTYVNTEGRVQRTKAAVGKLSQARDDWRTLRALSEIMHKPLPYDTLEQVRQRLIDIAPTFQHVDKLVTNGQKTANTERPSAIDSSASASSSVRSSSSSRLRGLIENYWFTDAISRSSLTMAKCNQLLSGARNSYYKSDA